MLPQELPKKFAGNLKNRCGNHGINKFILLLQKGLYPQEYMGDWKKFNETLLPQKEDFYSYLNIEDITDAYYAPAKRFCKDLKIKTLGEYRDLYVESDTSLLIDVFNNFWNMCLEIYGLNPAHFLSAPGLAGPAALTKTEVKLCPLTAVDMLLMAEKGVRGGICHAIHRHAKADNKYMKDYVKNKE